MLPEGKCRYIDGQIYPDGNFYVLDTQHIKHNGNELKSALNGISTDISNKVDKVTGKGLSTEDYTTAEKNKLSGIEANANNYVHPTTSGNKHIPSGGSSGKILGWSSDGTAAWVDPTGGGGGDVSSIKVGSTTYNPDSSGLVSLPAYPTSLPASDVYSWAKSSSKPSYSAREVGAVPTSRTINGYNLSANRTLTYSDVGAASAWTKTNVGFSASNYGVFVYTGLSITVPRYQVFMITAVDLYSNASPEGILIATSSSSLSGSVLIGKSESDSSSEYSHYARSVVAITPKLDDPKTYYIWVKRGSTGTNQVRLFTQRIE